MSDATVYGDSIPDFLERDADEVGLLILAGELKSTSEINFNTYRTTAAHRLTMYGADQSEIEQVVRRIAAGWQWLRSQGFLAPSSTQDPAYYEEVTREGLSLDPKVYLTERRGLSLLRDATLDPDLTRDAVRIFARGSYSTAVFAAMRSVEVRVREKSKLPPDLVGKGLMQEAFKPDGPLADPTLVKSEQEAILQLFVGSNGLFKNPPSHRTVDIDDPQEAAELVLFANGLLRVVERAAKAKQARELKLPRLPLPKVRPDREG